MQISYWEIVGISIGALLTLWGLFHQLIVGGAITMFRNISENEARLFVMSWVAQGAFMSFLGILPVAMLFLFPIFSSETHTVFLICSFGLFILSGHIFFTGINTHLKPIRISAFIQLAYGIYLLAAVLFT